MMSGGVYHSMSPELAVTWQCLTIRFGLTLDDLKGDLIRGGPLVLHPRSVPMGQLRGDEPRLCGERFQGLRPQSLNVQSLDIWI